MKRGRKNITLDSLMRGCYNLLRETREFNGDLDEGLKINSKLVDFYDALARLGFRGSEAYESYKPTFELIKKRLMGGINIGYMEGAA